MIDRDELAWTEGDRGFTLRGWNFATVHGGAPSGWVPGENCFLFYKTRALVDQYLHFFHGPARAARTTNVVELGLWDGGSVPFWFEALKPAKHVGIDIQTRRDTAYFEKYVSQDDRRERIETHWGTSQDDAQRLGAVVDAAFDGDFIDVVIDDASHLYEPSRASLEILLPRVRPGGYYILEDWAWSHWPALQENFAGHRPLDRLVFDAIEAMGSTSHRVIVDVHLCSGFAAFRRGWTPAAELGEFRLDRFIHRHPRESAWRRSLRAVVSRLGQRR